MWNLKINRFVPGWGLGWGGGGNTDRWWTRVKLSETISICRSMCWGKVNKFCLWDYSLSLYYPWTWAKFPETQVHFNLVPRLSRRSSSVTLMVLLIAWPPLLNPHRTDDKTQDQINMKTLRETTQLNLILNFLVCWDKAWTSICAIH